LRTPLNGLLGHAQLLRQDRGLGPEPSARVEVMVETGAHLLQVINRVLDLSEIENGHMEMKTAPTDLRSLADACFDLVLPAAGTRQLTLRLTVAPDVPARVMADATRLRQVLDTLLRNAVRFTAQGAVELRIRRAADNAGLLRFEIVDSGPGLSAEQRRRLYHDFDRLDAAALTSIEGVGLGLSIASRLVALMGGRLGHDDNPNGGSVFWVELPLPADAPEAAVQAPHEAESARPLPPLRLLVVDDVAMNRDIAEAFLLATGHQVACASSGMEAVLAVAAADFDAVLMDVRMPGMDGLEAARRIRAVPGPRGQVPLIALTAQAFSDQVAECREAGMHIHLSKPITQAALADALRRAIDRSAALPQAAAA
jgi:CheY-like chemotaxis protein